MASRWKAASSVDTGVDATRESSILAGRQPTKETDPEAANHTRHSAAKARVAQHRPSVVLGARQFAKAHVIGGEQKRKEDQ